MKKADLAAILEREVNLNRREAKWFVEGFLDEILFHLAENVDAEVALRGFGRFFVAKIDSRETCHPQTGERMVLPARTSPRFRPSKDLEHRATEVLRKALLARQVERVIRIAEMGIAASISNIELARCRETLRSIVKKRPGLVKAAFSGQTPEVQSELDKMDDGVFVSTTYLADDQLPEGLLAWHDTKAISHSLRSLVFSLQGDLPPLFATAEAKPISPRAVESVILLAASTRDTADPLVGAIKSFCLPDSLHKFAWSAYELWMEKGSSEAAGLVHVLGFWGDDDIARHLAAAAKSAPAVIRTLHALTAIARIGTPKALAQLQSVALFARYPKVRDRAAEMLDRIAKEKGLEGEQFQDQLVPTIGFEAGVQSFEVGGESFTLKIDESLRLSLIDATGKTQKGLPAKCRDEDTESRKQFEHCWKSITRELKQVARIQLSRMERAMVLDRRWRGNNFKADILNHPVLGTLASGLVWSTYSGTKGGKPLKTFSVQHDGTVSDIDGNGVEIKDDACVGIPHPLTLGAQIGPWKAVFEKARKGQPFAQLNRKIYRVEDDSEKNFFGLQGLEVPSIALKGLRAKGWEASVEDAGWIGGLYLGDASIHAHPGIHVSGYEYFGDTQKLEVSINSDDPVQFSELVRDLQSLRK